MREYFPKYSEVTRDIYDQVKGILRGYDRLRRKRTDLLHEACYQITGMPHGSGPGDPTAKRAIELSCIDERLAAIDQTCVEIRGWFGDSVQDGFDPIKAYWSYNYFNYQHERRGEKDDGPSKSTWNRYKHRLAAGVAEKLNIF